VFKTIWKLMLVGMLVLGLAGPASAFFGNKFEKELEKETGAVKLVREVQQGGYDVVATEELKKWIDSGKDTKVYHLLDSNCFIISRLQVIFC